MNCHLCDTANDELATFCSHCGAPLVARECPACSAVFDKSASRCPRCGEPASALAGKVQAAVSARAAAAVVSYAPGPANETDLAARLVKLLEHIEGELAARRTVAASLEQARAMLAPAAPMRIPHAVAQGKPRPALWLLVGGLLGMAAATGALYYRFHGQVLTFPAIVKFSDLLPVAAGPVALPPAPATQAEVSAQPAVQTTTALTDTHLAAPEREPAAAPSPPNPEPLVATTAPETDEPAERAQGMLARPEALTALVETANPPSTAAREVVGEPPAPGPKQTHDNYCQDGAVSAMGLCGATR